MQGISNKFARPNGLKDRQCEIDLLNEEGKSWTLELRHNKTTGQSYMCRGWTSFCQGNGIKAGSACRFKLVKNGTKPVLQLCPNTSTILHKKRDVPETEGDEIEYEDCLETPQMNQNRTVAIEFKPHMLRNGQLVSFNSLRLRVLSLFFFGYWLKWVGLKPLYSESLHHFQEITGSMKQER